MKPDLYQSFAAYNVWMSDKVYAAASRLTDPARKTDRGAFFGSIHSTLNHILFGDRAWMKRFTGTAYPLAPMGEDLFDDFGALNTARQEMERDITAFTSGLTEAWLAEDMAWTSGLDGQERIRPRWLLVSHMFNHQTHHRGQVTTLLNQAGQDVGSTDLPWMEG
ncbi:MAG: DinB family protein [Sphingomonadales bacterium]